MDFIEYFKMEMNAKYGKRIMYGIDITNDIFGIGMV